LGLVNIGLGGSVLSTKGIAVSRWGAMGKKGKWFGAVKKVFSPESKEKKEEVMLLPLNSSEF
jgi:hypothetical protein